MQEQRNDGSYGKPESLNFHKILMEMDNPDVKRFLIFPGYTESGKPTKELRRAWRRYKRKPIK